MAKAWEHVLLDGVSFGNDLSFFRSRWHQYTRWSCCLLLMFIFLPYISWGAWKLKFSADSGEYQDVVLEPEPWRDGVPMPAPWPLCVSDISPEGLEVRAHHTTIPYGRYAERRSTALRLVRMNVLRSAGVTEGAYCLTSRPGISGTYGDPSYQYITIEIVANTSLKYNTARAALVFNDQIGGYQTLNSSFYFTFLESVWTGVEFMFDRKQIVSGDRLGLSAKAEHFYKSYIAPPEEALVFHWMYSRSETAEIRDGKQEFGTFYIRSSGITQEVTYQPYSTITLFEDVGSLWITLSIIVAIGLLTCFCTTRMCYHIRSPIDSGTFNTLGALDEIPVASLDVHIQSDPTEILDVFSAPDVETRTQSRESSVPDRFSM